MAAPKVNVELLDQVMAQIEAHPDAWDQTFWATQFIDDTGNECGTAFCCAGWAVRLARPDLEFVWQGQYAQRVEDPAIGMTGDIEDVAQRLLGITNGEADRLFDERNTLDDLRYQVAKIKERAAER